MDTDIASLILLIVAVLQIILFFKVWKMCNNVQALTTKYVEEEPLSITNDFEARIAAGDKDIVNDLRKTLLVELKVIAANAHSNDASVYAALYGNTPQNHIAAVKDRYQTLFSELGETFPPKISEINTVEQLWKLFD